MFIVWAALTPVKNWPAPKARCFPAAITAWLQHLEGGLVKNILVHEGDFVQKDQLLMELDGAGLEEDFREQQGAGGIGCRCRMNRCLRSWKSASPIFPACIFRRRRCPAAAYVREHAR